MHGQTSRCLYTFNLTYSIDFTKLNIGHKSAKMQLYALPNHLNCPFDLTLPFDPLGLSLLKWNEVKL